MACIFYFFGSISLRHYQSLAVANSYHSLCYDFIRLGDGYRLIRVTINFTNHKLKIPPVLQNGLNLLRRYQKMITRNTIASQMSNPYKDQRTVSGPTSPVSFKMRQMITPMGPRIKPSKKPSTSIEPIS